MNNKLKHALPESGPNVGGWCMILKFLFRFNLYATYCYTRCQVALRHKADWLTRPRLQVHPGQLTHHLQYTSLLKLPSLFAAWLFWTFHTKSHNMKALVILSHSWSPILPLTCLYWKKRTFVGLCAAFWNIFLRKISSQITHTNHITTSGQL